LDIVETLRGLFVVNLKTFPSYKGVPDSAAHIADFIERYAEGDVTLGEGPRNRGHD
jgi:hypothetical protein